MKATTLLTAQHRKIERLFAALAGEDMPRHLALGEVVEALLEHMVMEEAVFYWISRQSPTDDLAQSYVAHGCARQTLTELMALEAGSADFRTDAQAVSARFEERIGIEDDHLIPRLELLFSDAQLERIASKIESLYVASLRESSDDAA